VICENQFVTGSLSAKIGYTRDVWEQAVSPESTAYLKEYGMVWYSRV